MFEDEYEALYRSQLADAKGQRKEMLEEDLAGTKLMLEVVYPVLGSLEGIVLEHEMVGLSGVKIYGDAFIRRWGVVLEEEHFITHAEMVTRKRFSFERARARSVAAFGFAYFPYSRDELLKQPDLCRRDLQQLLQARAGSKNGDYLALSVYEREALRAAFLACRPIGLPELTTWLQLERHACSRVTHQLVVKGMFTKIGGSEYRCHQFELSELGRSLLLGGGTSRT